jgi:hypothetical protein
MTQLEMIRLVGKEFEAVPDEVIENWIEFVTPMVSKKQFGKLYQQAIAYLVCHKLKMLGFGDNPLGEEFNLSNVGFGLSSVSEGGSSISFGASQSSNLAPDAELGLTAYGLQFLSIRRMVIVPIHVSGEDMEGVARVFWSWPFMI